MELAIVSGFFLGAVLLLAVLWRLLRAKPSGRLPPVKDGWIPWLGCAIEFGKEPLFFVQKAQKELGDIFTIHATGKRITFLLNPRDFPAFYQSPEFNFQAAVQPFTWRAACIPKESFQKNHSLAHDSIRNLLTPSHITKMVTTLSQEFHKQLCNYGNKGEMDFFDFVRVAMFASSVKHLYGEVSPKSKEGMKDMHRHFMTYDDSFERGCNMPEILLGEWRKSKYWLISCFKTLFDARRDDEGKDSCPAKSVVENVLSMTKGCSEPNYSLLLLWGTQANAIPATYWTLCHILSQPDIYQEVMKEVNLLQLNNEDGEFCPVTEDSLKPMKYLKRCVMEGVRLNPVGGVVRKVMEDKVINGYTIPAGDILMLCPYLSHRNPESFPEPEKFNPDRWLECDMEKNQVLSGFAAFGGGRYQCPGRWYALMEIQLFTAVVLRMFDLELMDPVPTVKPDHLVGVHHPKELCRVRYKLRL